VLSSINSGSRRLGYDLAARLADELGVSLLELGAPEGLSDPRGETLLHRLEELAEMVVETSNSLAQLHIQVQQLEGRLERVEAVPKRQNGN
jgi:hypothetical protein